MAITYDIKKDLRYKQGIEEGEKRGEKRGKKIGEIIGLLEGIELSLEIKFGTEGLGVFKKIKNTDDLKKLAKIKNTLKIANKISEIEKVLNA